MWLRSKHEPKTIYDALGITYEPMQPHKSWSESALTIAKSEM
jgi:hypothetical protein